MTKGKTQRIALAIICALAAIIMAGMATMLHRNTIVAWRWPVIISLIVGAAVALNIRGFIGYLTGMANAAVNYAVATALVFALSIGAFYTINYYGSDPDTVESCKAEVCRKYKEEHYQVRRLSRNRTVRGQKYYVYYMDIRLPDGRRKPMSISAGEYSRLKVGRSLDLAVEKGFFGIPVIKNSAFPVDRQKRF